MDINDEMEQLLAEATGDADQRKRKNKKKAADGAPSCVTSIVPPENLLKD